MGAQYSEKFSELIAMYRTTSVQYTHLKAASVAMWMLESGRGQSKLAEDHNNFAGMKWRSAMKPYGKRVLYNAHDGSGYYTEFNSLNDFISGFWAFLERSPYDGWHDHIADAGSFVAFIGPIWAEDPNYVGKVLDLLEEAESLVGSALVDGDNSEGSGHSCQGCGMGADFDKPKVDRWEPTSHQSSRNSTDIDHIVIHYTTSRNIEGTISHFKHGTPRTSAHYIVGRDGALVQMVNDSDNAWHAGSSKMNRRSIGIEHVAAPGDRITNAQGETSASLIGWLMNEYEVDRKNVIPHKCVKATSCFGDLFTDYGAGISSGCSAQKSALDAWMDDMDLP